MSSAGALGWKLLQRTARVLAWLGLAVGLAFVFGGWSIYHRDVKALACAQGKIDSATLDSLLSNFQAEGTFAQWENWAKQNDVTILWGYVNHRTALEPELLYVPACRATLKRFVYKSPDLGNGTFLLGVKSVCFSLVALGVLRWLRSRRSAEVPTTPAPKNA